MYPTQFLFNSLLSYLHSRYLYRPIFATDANFKLKLKSRDLDATMLSKGWVYLIENSAYMAHLAKYNDDLEVDFWFLETFPQTHHILYR